MAVAAYTIGAETRGKVHRSHLGLADPVAGQFTSADSVLPGGGYDLWGLSRYAYVEGNPENRNDPTGHINLMMGDDGAPVAIENAAFRMLRTPRHIRSIKSILICRFRASTDFVLDAANEPQGR